VSVDGLIAEQRGKKPPFPRKKEPKKWARATLGGKFKHRYKQGALLLKDCKVIINGKKFWTVNEMRSNCKKNPTS
jgi:hypothetical protein